MKKSLPLALSLLTAGSVIAATPTFKLTMEPNGGEVRDAFNNTAFTTGGFNKGEAVGGYDSNPAMRFDGYSTHVTGRVENAVTNKKKVAFSVWVAPENYPDIQHEKSPSDGGAPILWIGGEGGTDIAFWLNQNGRYTFMVAANDGKKYEPQSDQAPTVKPQPDSPLPLYQWTNLVGVFDGEKGKVQLFANGKLIDEQTCPVGTEINFSPGATLYAGALANGGYDPSEWGFMSFNGIIDDVEIFSDAIVPEFTQPGNPILAVPAQRYVNNGYADIRPTFHGMPSANWTNESHGLIFYDGKYHLFHQRNANSPSMSNQLWGHLVSDNLYHWQEAPIAFTSTPGGTDAKGAWSGCVVNDPNFNGGKPQIIYTGVDFGQSRTMTADLTDPANDKLLLIWGDKKVVVNSQPDGYDQFRDQYVYYANGKWNMIIGCGRNGQGALIRYEQNGQNWEYKGEFFSTPGLGSFWEMPTVCQIDGKWIVTVSTIGDPEGNNTHYWIGSIGSDDKFVATTAPRKVDFQNFAIYGYGLMSPSILQKDGKTIAMGIVPDQLGGETDRKRGWSHNFSLPREWNVSEDNLLIQKPFAGLVEMRKSGNKAASASGSGSVELNPANGREFEAEATFEAPLFGRFGFSVLGGVKVCYDMASKSFKVDASSVNRLRTGNEDKVSPNGVYSSPIPADIKAGDKVKIQIFVDHSIIDIFVNDSWASSVRVFPRGEVSGAQAFSDAGAFEGVACYDLDTKEIAGISKSGFSSTGGTVVDPVDPTEPENPDDPTEPVRKDPTGRYDIDENGRDIQLKKLDKMEIGMLVRGEAASLNVYEKAVHDYLLAECPEAVVLTDDDSEMLGAETAPKTIWVHVDQETGSSHPFSETTVRNLAEYVKKGGNLYLSGFAVRLVKDMGRIAWEPNIIGDQHGGMNPDIWTINIVGGEKSSYLSDNLFILGDKPAVNYPVIGALNAGTPTFRQDHNCMWDLGGLTPGKDWMNENANDEFEEATNSVVLATWGRDNYDYGNVGMAEFLPTGEWKGTIVANGIAGAVQFVHPDGENAWDFNQKRLHNNILAYLHGPVSETPENPDDPSGVDSAVSDSFGVTVMGGAVMYANAPNATVATVYDVTGRKVSEESVSGNGVLSVASKGINIVVFKTPSNEVKTLKLYVR